jgi:GDP-L-fucose synthase
MVMSVIGYIARAFDPTKPDGTIRKLLSVSRLLGVRPASHHSPLEGIAATHFWFKEHAVDARLYPERAVNHIGHCAFFVKVRTKYA